MNVPEPTKTSLRTILNSQIHENSTVGWEECVDIAMSEFLRTVLAKSHKDESGSFRFTKISNFICLLVSLPPLDIPSDPSKFKKHVLVFLDRIKKSNGILPTPQQDQQKSEAETTTIQE